MTSGQIPEQDMQTEATTGSPTLPSARHDLAPLSAGETDAERNEVFTQLVSGDTDIVGLVAYSIYKQNKLDWLVAFGRAKGREPNEAEVAAYIIGEGTPRRIGIYRHLAQATLEGRGPEVTTKAGAGAAPRNYAIASRYQPTGKVSVDTGRGTILAFVGLVIVALVAIYFAARFGLPGMSSR